MVVAIKALALYNNDAEDNDELSFKINDLLTIIHENWQNGWHLCQLGDKRGVAPANYLQIIVNPTPIVDDNGIYDSPRSMNLKCDNDLSITTTEGNGLIGHSIDSPDDGGTYIYSDYQNMDGNDEEDIYQNTSMMSLNSVHTSHSSLPTSPYRKPPPPPPSRPVPTPESSPPQKIKYPETLPTYDLAKKPALVSQNSEYMMMDGADQVDYDEIPENDDYDDVPDGTDYDEVPVRSSMGSASNTSITYMSSNQIYPMSPPYMSNDSIPSNKNSNESIPSNKYSNESIESDSRSSKQGPRDTPPSIPDKHIRPYMRFDRKEPSSAEDADYMVPPSFQTETSTRPRSNHDYFNPPSPPTKPAVPKGVTDLLAASDVVVLDEGLEYMTGTTVQDILNNKKTPDKRKKKSVAAVDQIPKLFNTLTLKKHKNNQRADDMAHNRDRLPSTSPPGFKTQGEDTRGGHKKMVYRDRPLPPPPLIHAEDELQDYAEISDDGCGPKTPAVVHPGQGTGAPVPPALLRQRSRSVTSPFASDILAGTGGRRHSNPIRPKIPSDSDDEIHDYAEVPEVAPGYHGNTPGYHGNTRGYQGNGQAASNYHPASSYHSCQSISSNESTGSGGSTGGYSGVPAHYPRPPLPTSCPPVPSSSIPSTRPVSQRSPLPSHPTQVTPRVTTPYSPPTNSPYSPPSLSPTARRDAGPGLPASYYDRRSSANHGRKSTVQIVDIDLASITLQDKQLIKVHCGIISSTLLRIVTENLIRLKQCTDSKDHEHYIDVCKSTATPCIEIVKRLTALTERIQSSPLLILIARHKQTLKDILKQLIENIKVAKVQFPALVAHNEMIVKRNELITCIREIKTFIVTLLQGT